MNLNEIAEALRSADDVWHQGWDYWLYGNLGHGQWIELGADLVARVVYSSGGYEGDGEHLEMVFEVKDIITGETHFYRKSGGYASFAGTYWDGPFDEVFPQQKTITVYEKA